jgi:hypothetical protein
MNRLLNITADAQIHKIDCATEDDVDEFEDNPTVGPDLNPMRPYLDSGRQTKWNYELSELFADHFQEEQEIILTKELRVMVTDMFLDRLSRLSRRWREYQSHTPEEEKNKAQRKKRLARRNTRRLDVSYPLRDFLHSDHELQALQ